MNDYEQGLQKCIPAVLVYIVQDDHVLMIHRNQNKDDIHFGKMNGLGGKLEVSETPLQAAIREIKEEANIHISSDDLKLGGVLFFPNFKPKKAEDWLCYVYKCSPKNRIQLSLNKNNEGELVWIKSDQILNQNLWEGDRFFIPKLLSNEFFVANISYSNGKLEKITSENL